ncbi:transcription factor GTE12 isoform X1 [Prunus yedoensis var. nudiflora]|uniref:Transcription factor GTE12 isoform X1 n=1 Tax=Prunus yedoensis var. nudiflora TaxID=2094558 RepID=A0A314Y7M7_PRUYE|nr:transcription factor GTE12 isoform X1 [Prunus yedoensis var. nudiflora]
MDLGTIKSKLEKNMYHNTEEFAADVRLTFSNAMVYNPPANIFHQMAKNLNKIFEMRWGLLGGKLNHGSSKVEPGKSSSGQIKKVTYTRQNPDRTPPFHNMSVTKRSMPSEEKVRVHVDTRQNPSRTPPFHNMSVTKRSVPSEEKVRVHVGASDGEAELSKTVQHCTPKLLAKNSNRGTDSGSRQASGSMNAKQPSSPVGRKCGSCGNLACRCGLPCDSMGRDHRLSNPNASRLDCQAKSLSTSQMSKSDPESDGAVSALDDENFCPSPQLTTPVTDAASGEEWKTSLFDVQLSPKRALRAAMLKSRFADTIWKAQQEKLLDQCTIFKLRACLRGKNLLEKARIEAEIRAAEAATRMRAEIELKQQRKRKREEARIALEKMQRTVEIDPNLKILEELERLTGFSPCTPLLNCKGRSGAFWGVHLRSPLEQLEALIAEEEEAEEGRFFGCYLLTSRSPRYEGHTYIRFTVNPRRRIRQHNGGNSSRCLENEAEASMMVLCIYGFPTNVSAHPFELSWQNPTVSKAGWLLQALNPWEGLSVRSNLHAPCSLSLPGRGLIVQSSADDQQDYTGNISNEAYGCSQVVGEDCTEKFGFMESPVRTPSSNVTTSFDTEVTKDIGLFVSSDDLSVKLGRPAREQSATVVADNDQSLSRSYLRPCGAEVIDLTTLAPLCRRDLCGKKSRVATVYPQIIDLTESTNFIQL